MCSMNVSQGQWPLSILPQEAHLGPEGGLTPETTFDLCV